MMGAPFNAEALVNRALAVVQARRAQRMAEGFEGAGAFQSFECAGRLLVLAGGFDAGGSGRWKALACVPEGTDRLETAPGITVKRLRASLRIQGKSVATKPKVLAEGLRDMTPEALADILDPLAPPMVRFDVRPAEAPTKRQGITPLSADVTGRRWEVM